MLRSITNAHGNMSSIDGEVVWRIWGLMVVSGTYVAAGVMVVGGKWYLGYLQCFRCGVISVFILFIFFFGRSRSVRWVMCMSLNVRDICFRACIWKEFLIFFLFFFLARRFVMGRLWKLIFHVGKSIFWCLLVGRC